MHIKVSFYQHQSLKILGGKADVGVSGNDAAA